MCLVVTLKVRKGHYVPLELIQVIVSHHVGEITEFGVLCKSNKSSQLLETSLQAQRSSFQ